MRAPPFRQGMVRSTAKYWVRMSDVSTVKHHILQVCCARLPPQSALYPAFVGCFLSLPVLHLCSVASALSLCACIFHVQHAQHVCCQESCPAGLCAAASVTCCGLPACCLPCRLHLLNALAELALPLALMRSPCSTCQCSKPPRGPTMRVTRSWSTRVGACCACVAATCSRQWQGWVSACTYRSLLRCCKHPNGVAMMSILLSSACPAQ